MKNILLFFAILMVSVVSAQNFEFRCDACTGQEITGTVKNHFAGTWFFVYDDVVSLDAFPDKATGATYDLTHDGTKYTFTVGLHVTSGTDAPYIRFSSPLLSSIPLNSELTVCIPGPPVCNTTLYEVTGSGVQHQMSVSTSFTGLADSTVISLPNDSVDVSKVKNGKDAVQLYNPISGETIVTRTIIKIVQPASWSNVVVDYEGEEFDTTTSEYNNGFGVRILTDCN